MRIIALLILVVSAFPAHGKDFSASARGTTSAQFLELGAGARAAALGGAYSAAAEEATALYWNPAAMIRIQGKSATFMHAAYVASSYFDYAAYAQNLGNAGALGASIHYFSAGGIPETDATGTSLGTFSPYDLAATLGYAYPINGYSVGIGAKFIRETIVASAQTVAADLGILSPALLDNRLRLAFTAVNFGGALKLEQAKENLPLAFRVGSSYSIMDRWLGTLDVAAPRSDRPYIAAGTEYQLAMSGPWRFAGRFGFNTQTIGSITGFNGISFGLGVGYENFVMDYAFVPLGGVGQAHRISLTFLFPDAVSAPKSRRQAARSRYSGDSSGDSGLSVPSTFWTH